MDRDIQHIRALTKSNIIISVRPRRSLHSTPHTLGSKKFGQSKPWRGAQHATLSDTEKEQLSWLSGHCIAQSTWRTYDTASRLFKWFCTEKNIPPTLPASADTITRFVLWLSFNRNVSHATISVYLAGLRQLHLQHGTDCPALRSEFIKMLLRGKKNSETRSDSSGCGRARRPATVETMDKLKAALRDSPWDTYSKRLIWTVCTILFFGALRSGEILCLTPAKFDPRFCACGEDIILAVNKNTGAKKLVLTVKVPKEEKSGADATVEIFQANSAHLCAVTSWEKWLALSPPLERGQPIFRRQDGSPFTQSDLNNALRNLLPGQGISSHSFRIGAATEMGKRGFADEDIKLAGRWNSGAFNGYVRMGKSRRSAVAEKFSAQI